MTMNHDDAVRLSLVEKYLLEELEPNLRDEFEEHYFDCRECADDVRATSAFLDAAKNELRAAPLPQRAALKEKKPWFAWLWTPAFAVPALAACLLVIAYQNFIVLPRSRTAIAELRSPEVLPALSLVGGNSRGGTVPSVAIDGAHAFLVSFDVPTQDRFSSYTCLLYSPTGSLTWSVQVSAEEAKDTVSIRVPAVQVAPGDYTLAVQGNTGAAAGGNGVDLAHYRFTLTR
jgi:hypothetical protein